MKIEYDNQVDAIYIRLQEKYVTRTVEIEDGLNIDLDENGKILGIELLNVSKRMSKEFLSNIIVKNLVSA